MSVCKALSYPAAWVLESPCWALSVLSLRHTALPTAYLLIPLLSLCLSPVFINQSGSLCDGESMLLQLFLMLRESNNKDTT